MLSHNDIKTYSLMTYSIQAVWINMFDSQNDIKTYSLITYSIIRYVVGALIMSLCHSVLALSLYVRGISVITPLPLGEGFGGGASW